jgi:hypothetical protein
MAAMTDLDRFLGIRCHAEYPVNSTFNRRLKERCNICPVKEVRLEKLAKAYKKLTLKALAGRNGYCEKDHCLDSRQT